MSAPGALFRAGTVNRRILSAAAAVTAAGIVVKVVATLKEFTVAGVYGRSDAMDAFLAAALIPGLLINLISESMNQALVPTLIRVREHEGRDRAQQLFSSSMLWTCLMLVVACAFMAIFARVIFPLIGSNFPKEKLDLAVRLFYGLLPVVVLSGIASSCTAVLNTTGQFALPGLAPVATPVAIIVIALLLNTRFGIWAMVYATAAGALAHAVWMVCMMSAHGYSFKMRWSGMNESTREVAQQFGPVFLSSVVASGGLLVDQSMAAMWAAGSVSALVYAGRFVSVVISIVGAAVSSAITPIFSQLVAERDWETCRSTMRTWAWLTALVSVPITVALVCGARILVRFTLQHGAFGSADTEVVAGVLTLYAIQIPFFLCSRVFYRFLVAMRRTDLIFWCGLLNLGLDIVLNLVLMRSLGVSGIALATSLWTVSTLVFLWYWSTRVLAKRYISLAAESEAGVLR